MPIEEEIRKAEQAVVVASRRILAKEAEHIDITKGDIRVLRERMLTLDALMSPLPSREEMRARDHELECQLDRRRDVAEQHWADCLRWVAKQSGHCEEPGDIVASGPWGDGCFYCWFKAAADKLEGRS